MEIPAHDLDTQYNQIKDEIDDAIANVVDNTDFILGDAVETFENEFADYCGSDYAIGVGSGTAALQLIYEALDLGDGDEVITTPFTFIATVEPILHTGAVPVFADINDRTFTLDPESVDQKITKNTKAIVAVHLYGQPAYMDQLRELADIHDIPLIEDAAQAHGARWKGERAGSIGDVAAFSFYPGKNLGAFGDAGGVTTNDPEIEHTIRKLRDHGREDKYKHSLAGFNHRMDGIQGAVLNVKLNYLDAWNSIRRENAAFYNSKFFTMDIETPFCMPEVDHVYHQYALRVSNRDEILEELREAGIGAGVHYPIPIHLQESFNSLDYSNGSFPRAESAANEVLSIPVHSLLSQDEKQFIVNEVKDKVEALHTSV